MNDKHDGFSADSPEALGPRTGEPPLPGAQAEAGRQGGTAENPAADIPQGSGPAPEAGRATSEPPEEMAELYAAASAAASEEAAAGSPAGELEANVAEQTERPSSGSGSETGNVPEAAAGTPYWDSRGAAAPPPQPPAQPPVAPANAVPPPPRGRMSGSLKVFFWILGTLTVGLILAFIVYSALEWDHFHEVPPASSSQQPGASSGSDPQASEPGDSQQEPQAPETDPGHVGIEIEPLPGSGQKAADEIYEQLVESVVGVNTTVTSANNQQSGTGQGTGIIATSDGYIITNSHVIYNSRNYAVQVVLHDGSTYDANVVGFDKATDVAILKIDAQGLAPATFGNANEMKVGQEVLAIGNPGGMSYAGSLTGGYISALNRRLGSEDIGYIQTDAAINPGNSGGPLVNMYGQVIGINTSKIVSTQYEGMGFSIPVVTVQEILNDLIHQGYVENRARLGITAQNLGANGSWGSEVSGVLIVTINDESSFSGVAEEGDIITKMDGEDISSLDDLYAILARHRGGDVVTVEIYHDGSLREERITLLEDKGETQQLP